MLLSEFDYNLPEERIAQTPIEPRDHSRLMVLNRKTLAIEHRRFYDLKDYLVAGDALIFNDTRVLSARLIGKKARTGGRVEVFLLTRLAEGKWEVLVKPGRKAHDGTVIEFGGGLSCEILRHTEFCGRVAKFHYDGVFEEILDKLGETPLPPYIKEKLADKERYQTVYAREVGSAAAPTAGLHFTKHRLAELEEMGVRLGFVTLHVGLGTFRPVKTQRIEEHKMHREFYCVSPETAALVNETKRRGNRVVAVGTTAIRTLEAAALRKNIVEAKNGWTEIFIYPGYAFKIVDALLTNFHLPKSTLLMLVSAFAGREFTLRAYAEAVKESYRFFSFGDAMFIS